MTVYHQNKGFSKQRSKFQQPPSTIPWPPMPCGSFSLKPMFPSFPSGSTANGEKESITLISMKNINMNNSKGCPSAEKVHFFPGSFLLLPPPFRLYFLNQKGDTLEGPESSFFTQPWLITSPILIMYLFCRFFKSNLGSQWIWWWCNCPVTVRKKVMESVEAMNQI